MRPTHFIILAAGVAFHCAAVARADSAPHAMLADKHRALLEATCVKCHGPEKQKGKFRVDDLSFTITTIADANRWQKVLNQLNSGEMPPEDAKQPESAMKTEFLDALSHTLVVARNALADQGGRITMRRLNRREYQNTMRDLLGVEVDVRDLPADGGAGSFDTVGSSLFMSSDQFEKYLELGRRALDEAIVSGPAPLKRVERREVEEDANRRIATRLESLTGDAYQKAKAWKESGGKPATQFGFTDDKAALFVLRQHAEQAATFERYAARPHADHGAFLTIEFGHPEEAIDIPADAPPGDYVLRLRVGLAANAPAHRQFLEMGHATPGRGVFDVMGSYHITGTIEQPELLEIPVRVGAKGGRSFSFREKQHNSRKAALAFYNSVHDATGAGPDPTLWIDWVEWEGPLHNEWPPRAHRALFFDGEHAAENDEYAREIIERFAMRAFRDKRPGADFVEKLARLYRARRDEGDSFSEALKEPLSVVLASPGFLYLAEASAEKGRRSLDDLELAVRLSYFLWSAPPDEELREVARRGELRQPAVLAKQVDRMLDSERSREFVRGFTHQWLGMERLDFFQFNFTRYRDFDESAKIAAKKEVFEFMQTLLRENLSARCLLMSDFITVNGLLATYYGLPGVKGDAFQKVQLPADSPRGGLLGMAAILAMGGDGERTSPVERGAWITRKLLNDPLPPAPPNVPQLTRLEDKLLTTRERLHVHQDQPQCASCHRKIDPIGFGLENFDAAGLWRTRDSYEKPEAKTRRAASKKKSKPADENKLEWDIDPAGTFHQGPGFRSYFELRDIIAQRSDRFARGLTEAMIEYALGRPFGYSDDDIASSIVKEAQQNDYALRSFIHALVASDAFQTK